MLLVLFILHAYSMRCSRSSVGKCTRGIHTYTRNCDVHDFVQFRSFPHIEQHELDAQAVSGCRWRNGVLMKMSKDLQLSALVKFDTKFSKKKWKTVFQHSIRILTSLGQPYRLPITLFALYGCIFQMEWCNIRRGVRWWRKDDELWPKTSVQCARTSSTKPLGETRASLSVCKANGG